MLSGPLFSLLISRLFLGFAIGQVNVLGRLAIFRGNDVDLVTLGHAIVFEALRASAAIAALGTPEFGFLGDAESSPMQPSRLVAVSLIFALPAIVYESGTGSTLRHFKDNQ